MAAENTDKLRKGYFGPALSLGSPVNDGTDTTIDFVSLAGVPDDTAIDIVIDREDENGNLTPDLAETVTGVVSGNTLIDVIRGVEGTAQGHLSGAVAEVLFTGATHNDSVDWGLAEHNQDGTHSNVNAETLNVSGATDLAGPVTIATPPSNSARFTGEIATCFLRNAPAGWLFCDGSAVSRSTYADLFAALMPTLGTVTITIATPGLVTLNGHGLTTSDGVYLTTTGTLPGGLTAGTTKYWVIVNDANSFWLASSQANADAGTKIATTGSQSGVHTMHFCPTGVGDGSTTFNVPDFRGRVLVGVDTSQTEFNTLGKSVGEKTHVLTINEMPAHTHTQHSRQEPTSSGSGFLSDGGSGTGTDNTGSQGGGVAHNNLQPSMAVCKIVKT